MRAGGSVVAVRYGFGFGGLRPPTPQRRGGGDGRMLVLMLEGVAELVESLQRCLEAGGGGCHRWRHVKPARCGGACCPQMSVLGRKCTKINALAHGGSVDAGEGAHQVS